MDKTATQKQPDNDNKIDEIISELNGLQSNIIKSKQSIDKTQQNIGTIKDHCYRLQYHLLQGVKK
jgi:hypothetical protein